MRPRRRRRRGLPVTPASSRAPLPYRHQRVQRLRRLLGRRSARLTERAFVAEGAKIVGEAVAGGRPVEALYVDAAALDAAAQEVVDAVLGRGGRVHELAPGVLERVAGTVTPQPLLAVVPFLDVTMEALESSNMVVVCADVRDPGNLGTVLRSAEAAGAGGVICCDGSVDVYNPKCVRASAGAIFHVPVVAGGEAGTVLTQVGEWGMRRLGTSAHGGEPLDGLDLTGPVAFVLGNEAHGLPARLAPSLDGYVTIPMAGRSDSLNVGMATTVIVFEAARQRRSRPPGPAG